MTKTETKKAVPLPEAFPASPCDFQRLVIATDDAAERYENFCVTVFGLTGRVATWQTSPPPCRD
jgi:hypothetical protein